MRRERYRRPVEEPGEFHFPCSIESRMHDRCSGCCVRVSRDHIEFGETCSVIPPSGRVHVAQRVLTLYLRPDGFLGQTSLLRPLWRIWTLSSSYSTSYIKLLQKNAYLCLLRAAYPLAKLVPDSRQIEEKGKQTVFLCHIELRCTGRVVLAAIDSVDCIFPIT